ncbi:MAG: GAF domain-containing protein [Leptolyngbyaceae cyanobacterium bins.302]|nr:GAF domain-containing protein [Leptolyngbyaceae cyanobacterium bins.302]
MTHSVQNSTKILMGEPSAIIERNPIIVQSDLLISQFVLLIFELQKTATIGQPNDRTKPFDGSYLDALEDFTKPSKIPFHFTYALVKKANSIVGVITIQDLLAAKTLSKNLELTVADVMRHQATLISGTELKLFLKTFSHFRQYWLHYLAIVNEEGTIRGIIPPQKLQNALTRLPPNLKTPGQESLLLPSLTQTTYDVLAQKTVAMQHLERQLKQKTLECEELQQKLQWQNRSKQVLNDTALKIDQIEAIPIQHVLNQILLDAQKLLQADRLLIYQYQPDWSGFVLAEVAHKEVLRLQSFLIRDGLISDPQWIQQYHQGKSCVVIDLKQDSNKLATTISSDFNQTITDLLEFFEVRAMLAVPILVKGSLWGLVVIHHCFRSHSWESSEIDFVRSLTIHLSHAIVHSTLANQNGQLKLQLTEKEKEYTRNLSQTLAYAEMLQRITNRVRDSLDEQQILKTAVEELVTVLEVCSGKAVLCGDGTCQDYDSCYQAANFPIAHPEDEQLSVLPELYLQLYRGEHSQFCQFEPYLNRGKNTILVCPIFDDQVYLGYLALFAHRTHQFEETELRVVQQVANHCAIAVRQAQLYEASQTQVRELERLNQLKDDFLSTVSHELRTPLSSIKMVANLLKIAFEQENIQTQKAEENKMTGKIAQYFSVLQEECDREIKLVNDLLAVQHLNAGDHPLSLSRICLNDWLPLTIEKFDRRARDQHQHIELQRPDDLVSVVCDMFMLDRILTELLNNACKYTPPEELIAVRLTSDQLTFQLQISNTGIEISEDQILHIFEPFYRIPSNDPWKQGGTGLGLSLIKKIAEYLNGRIWVESSSKQVHFFVRLPLHGGSPVA